MNIEHVLILYHVKCRIASSNIFYWINISSQGKDRRTLSRITTKRKYYEVLIPI